MGIGGVKGEIGDLAPNAKPIPCAYLNYLL